MMTLNESPVAGWAIEEKGNFTPGGSRPVVRLLWGRGLGSTYQGFYRETEESLEDAFWLERGVSRFSRPLSCPKCQEPLILCQATDESPDRLIGDCQGCHRRFWLEVAPDGRVTPSDGPASTTDWLS